MYDSVFRALAGELELFFRPVLTRLTSGDVADLLGELGWWWPEGIDLDVESLVIAADELLDGLGALGDDPDAAELLAAIAPAADLAAAVVDLAAGIPDPEGLEADARAMVQQVLDEAAALGERTLALLVVRYLEMRLPLLLGLLEFAGVIRRRLIHPDYAHPGHDLVEVEWSYLPKLVSDPGDLFGHLYSWGRDAELRVHGLLVGLERIALLVGLPASRQPVGLPLEEELLASLGADLGQSRIREQLVIPLLEEYGEATGLAAIGVSVMGVPDPHDPTGGVAGLALVPYASGYASFTAPLSPHLEFETSIGLAADLAVVIPPGGEVIVLELGEGSVEITARSVLRHAGGATPVALLGVPGGTRFEYLSARVGVGLVGPVGALDFSVEAELDDAALVVEPGDGDSFVDKLMPGGPIRLAVDTTIGFSSRRGFYFGASGSLDVTIPVHETLGPITIASVYLSLVVEEAGSSPLDIRAALSGSAELGPVSATVEKIGARLRLSLPGDGSGNLGAVDLSSDFLPPTGAGLVIDASGLTGGGYLEFDSDNERYAGIVELAFGEIGLVAVGLITTRLPDGSKGFSMVLSIGVTFSPPFQLSFGFTLSGVGGLIGIHRTMMVDVLQDGIRQGSIDSVLFPTDPIANAPRIISDLRAVFPPEEGHFVIGPMIKLGWGTPNIIALEIGVLVEVPDPIRIAILGQLYARLPDEDAAIVSLNIEMLGIIDFGRKRVSIDASLRDSHIAKFTLTGDAALRLDWGKPELAMSLGGFHPKFKPPTNFPSLRRLALGLSSGDSFRLTCETYAALTPNSLQFGARVELYASAAGATLDGHLGFDALFYFSPFSFEVSISGKVLIMYQGTTLAGVAVSFVLSGPSPWNARGHAKFQILFWEVKARFDVSWGAEIETVLPAIDPLGPFVEALEDPAGWGSKLPSDRILTASIQPLELESDSTTITVHPAGTLEIRQNRMPLGQRLDKLGSSPVEAHHTLRIDSVAIGSVGEAGLELSPVEEHFARGQYERLSQHQQLSVPSFEAMQAGVGVATRSVKTEGASESYGLRYESILIDDDGVKQQPKPTDSDWSLASPLINRGAAAVSRLRGAGLRKYETKATRPKVTIGHERFSVVDATTLQGADVEQRGTRVDAERALAAREATDAGSTRDLRVVPSYEVMP